MHLVRVVGKQLGVIGAVVEVVGLGTTQYLGKCVEVGTSTGTIHLLEVVCR